MYGLFIGSFNPPTLAHLEICLRLKKRYQNIVMVPVNSKEKSILSMEERINMLSIYAKKYPFIKIDNIMDNYSYLNYRIIHLLKKKYPSFELIIGSDLLEKLDSFEEYEYLLENYYFLVVTRQHDNVLEIIKKKYTRFEKHFHILEYNSSISSSLARTLIKDNQNLEKILDKDIIDYIKDNHLYV